MTPARMIGGVAVSPGLAIGPVQVVLSKPVGVPEWSLKEADVPGELARLRAAVAEAAKELGKRQEQVARDAGEKDAQIFAVHRAILQDPKALRDVEESIDEQLINAEKAVQLLIDRFEKTMGRLEGDYLRSYASDFSDPWFRVLDALLVRGREEIVARGQEVILAAEELTPQVVTYIERDRVLGVICEKGGRFSHGAVLARSMGVPCVVGLPNLLARLEQDMVVTINGSSGSVQLKPDQEDIDEFLDRRSSVASRLEALQEHQEAPAISTDGQPMNVCVNIESVRDFDTFEMEHTNGVGLLRTEFLYLERPQFPSEEEQFRMYRRVLERAGDRPVVIRTLDIGGDKPLPYFTTPHENNPALGWRGLRITLQWRDLLRVQLRALLRASIYGNLRILLPMVTSLEEVKSAHEVFDGVRKLLTEQSYEVAEDVPVGVMIEVPSLLLVLDHVLPIVDFASVGTNDLIQYLLAADRDNTWVSSLYDPHHPAVLRALDMVARGANDAKCPVSVCGELAGDPATAILLLGLGYDSISIAPNFLPEIKFAIRTTSSKSAREFARAALEQKDSKGIRNVLDQIRSKLYDQPSDPSCTVGNE